jgi:luciferase-like monooxygenase
MAMKFGVLHFFEHAAGGKTERQIVREQLDCMRAAEDMGFDSVWAPEHHSTEYGFSASPMVTLAAGRHGQGRRQHDHTDESAAA